ncbi:MAG: DinB family protein [Phycisphaerales bacterium]|nr:DinB family protein [Phycisphaerales bacterium]
MSQDLIARFTADADILHKLTAGLTREQLTAFPVPGTWSMQQLVVHLLDSDLIAVHRMKRIIAEEAPLLISYDETAFAARLHYHGLDTLTVCELFRLNRLHMGEILRNLPALAFDRHGIHNQRGKVTLREMLELYVHHVDHHLPFAEAKRKKLGAPLAR